MGWGIVVAIAVRTRSLVGKHDSCAFFANSVAILTTSHVFGRLQCFQRLVGCVSIKVAFDMDFQL